MIQTSKEDEDGTGAVMDVSFFFGFGAAILGFHSMMNQDQYHASLLNKGKVGLGWDGVTKASQPKALPFEPPNSTDPEESIKKILESDRKTLNICLNNVAMTDDQFRRSVSRLFLGHQLSIST